MLYFLAIIVFFICTILMVFSKDSYISLEYLTYLRMLNEPYMNRAVLMFYDNTEEEDNL